MSYRTILSPEWSSRKLRSLQEFPEYEFATKDEMAPVVKEMRALGDAP